MRPNRAARVFGAAAIALAGLVASGCLSFTHEIWVRRDGSARVLNTVALDPDFVRTASVGGTDGFDSIRKELQSRADEIATKAGVRWARARVRQEDGGRQFDLEYDVDDVRLLPDLGRSGPDASRAESTLPALKVERTGRSELAIEIETNVARIAGRYPYYPLASLATASPTADTVIVRIHAPRIASTTGALATDRRLVEWRFPLRDLIESRRASLPQIRAEVELRPWSMVIVAAAIVGAMLVLVGALVARGSLSGSGAAWIAGLALTCLGVGGYAYVESGRIGKPAPPPEPGPPPTTLPPPLALPLTMPGAPIAPSPSPTPPVDVARLRELLQSSDRMTRISGLVQVTNLGPRAVEAANDIVPMLGDSDPGMRARAVRALGRTGPEHARAIVPLLSDPVLLVKVEAACALVATPYAGMTPALLTDQLAQRDETIRGRAAECLGDLGPRAASSVPALMAAVTNIRGGAFARYHATAALGRIGPAASQAIPVLESVTTDPERYVRQAAVEALRQLRGESSVAPGGGAPAPMASPVP